MLVDINLAKLVPSRVKVKVEGGRQFYQDIEIRRMSMLCGYYKILGHEITQCRALKKVVQSLCNQDKQGETPQEWLANCQQKEQRKVCTIYWEYRGSGSDQQWYPTKQKYGRGNPRGETHLENSSRGCNNLKVHLRSPEIHKEGQQHGVTERVCREQ